MSVATDSGYVTDLPYVSRAYPAHAPVNLKLTATIAGFHVGDLPPGAVVLELGCGFGNGMISAAVAHRTTRFLGIDFNPTQIAAARRRIADLGIDNVEMREADFLDLAADPNSLPLCDMVILHGVYAWVGADQKAALRTILRHCVRPGGLVFLSYNAMPGAAGMGMVQRALFEAAHLTVGRSDDRLTAALGRIKALREVGAAHLSNNARLDRLFEGIDEADPIYLAHEYMNRDWRALYHADVARDMAEAKLNFIGSALPHELFPALMLNPDQAKALGEVPISSVRETLRDYFIERVFRKDLFARGAPRMTEAERTVALDATLFCSAANPDDVTMELNVPAGKVALNEWYPEAARMLWREGPQRLSTLMAGPFDGSGLSRAEAAAVMVTAGLAWPCLENDEAATAATAATCRRGLVAARENIHRHGLQTWPAVLAPRLGSEFPISGLEALVLEALSRGLPEDPVPLAQDVWAPFRAAGESLMHKGEAVTDPDQCIAMLVDMIGRMLPDRVPLWRALGMLPDPEPAASSRAPVGTVRGSSTRP